MKDNDSLNLRIEKNSIILSIEKIDDGTLSTVDELADYAHRLGLAPYVEFERSKRTISEFRKYYDDTFLTPQDRSIKELKERFAALEVRVSALENTSPAEPEQATQPSKKKYKRGEHPIVRWHNRFKAGDAKVHKIAAILDLCGLSVRGITPGGYMAFGPALPKEIKAIQSIETIYDERGEAALRKIANAIASLDNAILRKEVIMAADYALFESPKKMTPESFTLPAKKVLSQPWDDLNLALDLLIEEHKINRYVALGKIITGELSI